VTKVFLIGPGPIWGPETTFFNAQALRTWQIATVLRESGHEVILTILQTEGAARKEPNQPPLIAGEKDGLPYATVNAADPAEIVPIVQSRFDQYESDCLVAINLNAAWIASQLATSHPMWVDLYGHLMGEAQAKSCRYNSDDYLAHFWARERLVLRRGDRFSTASYCQMYATLGELGAVGRLNQYTPTHPFVDVIPAAASRIFLEIPNLRPPFLFRGKRFPPDAFAVLWSGGFNTWTDPQALAGALSLAMERDKNIYFVATGAAIPGHDEITYQQFVSEMEKSGYADRCLLLGWIEAKDLPALYRECDLGLNMDALNYETLFGTRTRLVNMMAAGLPILTTLGTELSEIIREYQLGYTVKVGDVQGYADMILHAARNTAERRTLAAKARQYALTHFSEQAVARPLLRWIQNPSRAPDNEEKIHRFPNIKNPLEAALSPLELELKTLSEIPLEELLAAHRDLRIIRNKPLVRIYRSLKRWFRTPEQ